MLLLGGKHFHKLCLSNFPWTEPRGATCATRRRGAALARLCKLSSPHAASRRISMHAASQSPDSHVWRKTALKSADRKLKTPQRVCSNLSLHVQEEQLLPVLRRPSSILRNEFSIALFHSELRLVFLFPLQFPQSAPREVTPRLREPLLCTAAAKTSPTGACGTPPPRETSLVPLALCFVAVEILLCSLPMLGVLAQEPLPLRLSLPPCFSPGCTRGRDAVCLGCCSRAGRAGAPWVAPRCLEQCEHPCQACLPRAPAPVEPGANWLHYDTE